MKVPRIQQYEPYHPIPKGTYRAKIVDVEEPKRLKLRPEMFRVCFVLEIGDRKGFAFYAGYLNTIIMIYRNKALWIGTDVTVKVDLRSHKDQTFNSFDILWRPVDDQTTTY